MLYELRWGKISFKLLSTCGTVVRCCVTNSMTVPKRVGGNPDFEFLATTVMDCDKSCRCGGISEISRSWLLLLFLSRDNETKFLLFLQSKSESVQMVSRGKGKLSLLYAVAIREIFL